MAQPTKHEQVSTPPSLWRPEGERERVTEEAKRWLEENADAFKSWNDYIDKNGLPLAKYRPF